MIFDFFRKQNKLLNDKSIAHRKRVRAVYSTKEGRQELFNYIKDAGLLQEITPEFLGNRNFIIKKLEEIGILDECVIKKLIDYYFDSIPESRELIEAEEYKEKGIEVEDPFEIK